MNRRRILGVGAVLSAVALLSGHTPYRQWKLYRQHHLLIFTSRDDPESDELGEQLAARLREALPNSRAQVARAPHADRIASLLTSQQADVAVLTRDQAAALYRNDPPFRDYPPIALRVLAANDRYVLVCREDFKLRHAFLIAEALTAGEGSPLLLPSDGDIVPAHAGARAAASGTPPDE